MRERKVSRVGNETSITKISDSVREITISGDMDISPNAFATDSNITTAIIYGTVSRIGKKSFYKCLNLSSVELRNGIKEIGDMAFEGCTSLHSLKIPPSVSFIGKGAFPSSDEDFELAVVPESAAHIYAVQNSIKVSFYNQPMFTVIYQNAYGVEIGRENVLYGEDCKKQSEYGLLISNFASWDNDTKYVTKNMILRPLLKAESDVSVLFCVDNEIVFSQIISKGDEINYDAATDFVKQNGKDVIITDTNTIYQKRTFSRWDKTETTAEYNLVINAVYESTEIAKHKVTFECLGQTVSTQYILHLQTADYELAESLMDKKGLRDVKNESENHYFQKWSIDSQKITEDTSIIAEYLSYYRESEMVGESIVASFLKNTLTISGTGSTYEYTDSKPDFYRHKNEIADIYIESEDIEFSEAFLNIIFECCDIDHIHGNIIGVCGDGVYFLVQNEGQLIVKGEGQLKSTAFDNLKLAAQNIREVKIPNTITNIEYGVLNDFTGLEKLTLPYVGASKDVAIMSTGGKDACLGYLFEESETPKTGFVEQMYIVDGDIIYSKIPQTIQEIEITDAEIIPFGAFQNIKNLKKLTINDSCERIYGKILKGCNKIEEIVVPFIGRHYCYSEYAMSYDLSLGYWFDFERISIWYNEETDDWMNCREEIFNPPADMLKTYRNFEEKWDTRVDDGEVTRHKTLYGYKACQYTTPNSLKKITITGDSFVPTGAFAYEDNIEEVIAPKATAIGWFCFYNARKLKKVDMPKLEKVFAFGFCKTHALTKVPYESIKYIESFAFAFSGIEEYEFREDCEFATFHYLGDTHRKYNCSCVFSYTPIRKIVLTKSALKSMSIRTLLFTISGGTSDYYMNSLFKDEANLYMPQLSDYEYKNVTSDDIIKFADDTSYTVFFDEYQLSCTRICDPQKGVSRNSKFDWLLQSGIPNFNPLEKKQDGQNYYYQIKQYPDIIVATAFKDGETVTLPEKIKYIYYSRDYTSSQSSITINIDISQFNVTRTSSIQQATMNITGLSDVNSVSRLADFMSYVCTFTGRDQTLLIDGKPWEQIPMACYAALCSGMSKSKKTDAVIENAKKYSESKFLIEDGVLKKIAFYDYDITVPDVVNEISESVFFPTEQIAKFDIGQNTKICNSLPFYCSNINLRNVEYICVSKSLRIQHSMKFPKTLKDIGPIQLIVPADEPMTIDLSETKIKSIQMPCIESFYSIEKHSMPAIKILFPSDIDIEYKHFRGDSSFYIANDRKLTIAEVLSNNDSLNICGKMSNNAGALSPLNIRDSGRIGISTSFSTISVPEKVNISASVLGSFMFSSHSFTNVTLSESVNAIAYDAFDEVTCTNPITFKDGKNRVAYIESDSFQAGNQKPDNVVGPNNKTIGFMAFDHTRSTTKELVLYDLTADIGGWFDTVGQTPGWDSNPHIKDTFPQWLNYTTNCNYGDHQWYDFGTTSYYKSIEVDPRNQDFKTACSREDGVDGDQVLLTRDGKRLITMARGAGFKDKILKIPEGVERFDSLSLGCKWTGNLQILQLPDSFIMSEFYCHLQHNAEYNTLTEPMYFDTSIREFRVKPTNTKYICIDGMLFSRNRLDFWAMPISKYGECLTIPKGTTTIKHGAIPPYNGSDIAPTYTSKRNLHFRGISIPASVSSIDNQVMYDGTLQRLLRIKPPTKKVQTQLYILNQFAGKTSVNNSVTGKTENFSFTLDPKNRWYKIANGKLTKITAASEIAANNFKFSTTADGTTSYSDGIAYNYSDFFCNGFARVFLMALNFLRIYDYDDINEAVASGKWDTLCKGYLNAFCMSGYNINSGISLDDFVGEYDLHHEFLKHRNDLAGLKEQTDNFKNTNLNPVIIKIVTNGDNGPCFHYFLPTQVVLSNGNYEITAYGGIDYNSNINTTHLTNTNIDFNRPFKIVWNSNGTSRKIYAHYRSGEYKDTDKSDAEYSSHAEFEDSTQYKVQDFMKCAVGDILWAGTDSLMRYKFEDGIDFLSKMWETLEQ